MHQYSAKLKIKGIKILSGIRIRRVGKACCVALLALLLSRFVVYDISSLSYFAPLEKASDYIASDFYVQVAQGRAVKRYEDRLVVVSSDHLDRRQLSELFTLIAEGKPAVTAIDIIFDERGDDSDLQLLESIDALGNVVYPVVWSDGRDVENVSENSIYKYLKNAIPGVVNLDAESARNIIRSFSPCFGNKANRQSLSFATAAVNVFNEKLCLGLNRRDNDHELIDFADAEFDVLSPDDIKEDPSIVGGRIVMVGDVADFSDIHATPVQEDMPGVMVHAYAASTILSGSYITELPRWLLWFIAFIVSVPMIYAQLSLEDTKSGNMIVRWLQVAMLLMLIIAGTALYLNSHISLDLTLPLLMVALGLLAADLWSFLSIIPNFCKTKLKPVGCKILSTCKSMLGPTDSKKTQNHE